MLRGSVRVRAVAIVLCALWLAPAPAADLETLMLGKPTEPDTLDPHVAQSNNSLTVTCKTYETLVKFAVVDGRATADVVPGLAQSWTVDATGKVWDFTLAPGHRFSSGRSVDAAAVKFSFDRLLEIAKGPNEDYPAIASTEVRNPQTVRFTLTYPFAPFLASLASCAGEVVDPAVLSHAVDNDFAQGYLATHSMGSGPYRVAEVEKGQRIVLEPNPYFFGPPPRLKRIVIKIIKEAAVRRLELEKGDLDLIEEVSPDQVDVLRKKPGIVVVDEPCFRQDYLFFNTAKAPLDNVLLRQALSYAVDYQGIIDGVLLGKGRQMRGFIPQGFWGHDDRVLQYHYDPERARALLSKAGVAHLKLSFLYAKADPTWETVGLVVQQNFADIGVTLDLKEYAYSTMRDMVDRGDFEIAIGNYTPDFADPSQYLNYWVDSRLFGLAGNRAFYRSAEVDDLIRRAISLSDVAERTRLYQKAQSIAVTAAAYLLLSQKNYDVAMRANVHGYVYNPLLLQVFDFEDMWKTP
jgi:peptide/nickel transport system substrate-binding protein